MTIEGSVTTFWGDQEVETVIEVECKKNHALIGEAKLTCETFATWKLQWSSDPPTCIKMGK